MSAGDGMKLTVTLDENLLMEAMEYSGIKNKSELVRVALHELIQWRAAQRLADMGGSDPTASVAPRNRHERDE